MTSSLITKCYSPVLREDIDSRRVVSAVREVQSSELWHQVHKTASHSLLVLRKPVNINGNVFRACYLEMR